MREAGGGEAEGSEQTEQALIERAFHGDQHAAHEILRDQGRLEEAPFLRAGPIARKASAPREDWERGPSV